MQILRLANSLHRCDVIPLVPRGQAKTGIHAPAIDVHGARAALTMIAPLLRPGQMKMFAQTIKQAGAGIEAKVVLLPVDKKRDRNGVFRLGYWHLSFPGILTNRASNCPGRGQQSCHAQARQESAARRSAKAGPQLYFTSIRVFAWTGHANASFETLGEAAEFGKLIQKTKLIFLPLNPGLV
jgi:hypothetical protein